MHKTSSDQILPAGLDKLPSIPHVLLKLLEIISDPDVEFTQITRIIQSDPALTTRIMSVANSGAYSQWHEYKDFHRIVVAMGLNMVKTITINSAVQQFFSQFNVDDKGILAAFWKTSLTAACVARNLAGLIGYNNKDEAYIAGLLHKMGELVCLTYDAEEYMQRSHELYGNNPDVTMAELEVLRSTMEQAFIGASIPEISAAIIQQFDPQTLLSDALLYQREPAGQLAGTPLLLQIINLTHKLAEPSFKKEDTFAEVTKLFDLNNAVLEELLEKSLAEVKNIAQDMGLKILDDNSIQSDNESAQIKLAEHIRTIALSNSLQETANYRSEKGLFESIMQNLSVLFGLSNCIYLEYDEHNACLKAKYANHIEESVLEQFSIPLDAVLTLPVQALLGAVPLFSQEDDENKQKSVLDQQLQRLLQAQETLCIPLQNNASVSKEKYGVLVAGITPACLPVLKQEKGLLYEFSRSTSQVISRDKKIAQQIQVITEEQQAQQSLNIRKLVHEANNPLGVIRNYLQILSHKLEDSKDEKLQGQLEILMAEVERVGNIILKIKDVPEIVPINNNRVNVNEIISRLVSVFQDSLFLKTGIKAILDLDETIPVLAGNINSLKQIVTNLLKNAVEAMPEGGEIQITTRDRVNDNGHQFIELSIIDNGPGIPGDIIKNLFNPVQSTKSKQHSGLGLSICKNLVNELDGTIRGSNRFTGNLLTGMEQQTLTGAEFIILLPRRLN